MVEPFYAMKCNPDPVIVKLLATLGCGFDCATMGEIDLVLNGLGSELSFGPNGLAGPMMVYANPAKF
jgi:ornithine decarboxylase